ncbi:MAG: hypothetical protein DLM68_18180 [Hyphomicrobiales bacterium]|nr:MAG: hypothetical protein DLM68_18180 [Hyphomicrobiales bacterium]
MPARSLAAGQNRQTTSSSKSIAVDLCVRYYTSFRTETATIKRATITVALAPAKRPNPRTASNAKRRNGQQRPRDRTVDLFEHERGCLADGSADFERPLLNEALRFRIRREVAMLSKKEGQFPRQY